MPNDERVQAAAADLLEALVELVKAATAYVKERKNR